MSLGGKILRVEVMCMIDAAHKYVNVEYSYPF